MTKPTTTRASRAPKTSERVARQILQDVIRRGLCPGDTLPSEARMMSEYGVGRASLREALRILEINGLVTIKPGPGGGPVLGSIDAISFGRMSTLYFQLLGATVRELVEARIVMEPVMARLAADHREPEGMSQIRQVLAEGRTIALDDHDAYRRVTSDFHAVLLSHPGNRVMGLYARALEALFAERITGALFEPAERRLALDHHEAIGEAVLAGAGERAEQLMRHHIEQLREAMDARLPGLLDGRIDWM